MLYNLLIIVGLGAVSLVLLAGLFNMLRPNKTGAANRSQLLMRWRVGLQFATIIIVMLGFYFISR